MTGGSPRPRSTRAQVVTAVCAALIAAFVFIGGAITVMSLYVAGSILSAFGEGVEGSAAALAVPAVESICLNYATAVLELDAAGLNHDAIVRVIETAVAGADNDPAEMDELRELSLTSADACGPVRGVLDAAGR